MTLARRIRAPFWRSFATQQSLRAAIRAVVNPHSFDTPFDSDLLSDLIAERHYYCRWSGIRPTRFKKTRENQPYRFYGLFSHGWHPVSWEKCISAVPTKRDLIVRALRTRTEPSKTAFRRAHPVCQRCGQNPSEETHHACPTFRQIIDETLHRTVAAEIDSVLASWNWFAQEEFTLPEDHVIARTFDTLHRPARLEALCQPCHRKAEAN